MAASGIRLGAVGRLGVAFFATAAVALGSALPASAQDPATAPATETTPAETTTATTTAPPAATETAEPKAPTAEPAAAPKVPDAEPAGGAAEGATPAATGPAPESAPAESAPTASPSAESAPAESAPAQSTPAASEPSAATGPAVKLEPAAPAAAPAPAAPLAAPAAQVTAQPATAAAAAITIQLPAESTVEPQSSATEAASPDDDTASTAHIVSLKAPAAASPISLLPGDEAAAETVRAVRALGVVGKPLVQRPCTRPPARVPLSQLGKQARAIAVLRATLISAPSPEVRAAIDRVAARVTIRRVEARPPPESKAAKEHPVAKARPIAPFGHSGQGIVNDGFNGAVGSTSSSRLFALAAVPLRVPLPFRFARLRLPSTRPHGVIAAPPTARPG